MNISVVTPISHIPGLLERLEQIGDVNLDEEANRESISHWLPSSEVVFTNPNKAGFFMGRAFFEQATNLRVICTASTGTTHIDLEAAEEYGVTVLSLRDEVETLKLISSTAEHALALTMAGLRNLCAANLSVRDGNWNYEPFIGRQLSTMTVGVVGHGRLGSMYAKYAQSLAREVLFFDPEVERSDFAKRVGVLEDIFVNCDVVSLHVHVSDLTAGMVGQAQLDIAKPELMLVNTSRGELVDEAALVAFLEQNPRAKYLADVISDEQHRFESPAYEAAMESSQIFLTPHVGGMTREGQSLAFHRAVEILERYLESA